MLLWGRACAVLLCLFTHLTRCSTSRQLHLELIQRAELLDKLKRKSEGREQRLRDEIANLMFLGNQREVEHAAKVRGGRAGAATSATSVCRVRCVCVCVCVRVCVCVCVCV